MRNYMESFTNSIFHNVKFVYEKFRHFFHNESYYKNFILVTNDKSLLHKPSKGLIVYA